MNKKDMIQLEACRCGGYHLRLGRLSICLDKAELKQLGEKIQLAQRYPQENKPHLEQRVGPLKWVQ